jgi:GT2 family glycosyltransferase
VPLIASFARRMPLHELTIGENLGLRRGDAVVCIPVYGAYDLFAQCLLSVLRHTGPGAPILICDDATPDPRVRSLIEQAVADSESQRTVHYLRQPENVGFVENVNAGMAVSVPADVLILNSDCVVTEGWFGLMRDAAYSESRIATVTALTNAGTIVSIPHRNHPIPQLPGGLTPDRVAAVLRDVSLRLRPDIPTCVGHCVYIRRTAIDLVGEFDTAFSPGYEEEVDFSQRCILHGLRHIVADDVFVLHRHAGSFGSGEEALRRRADHHAIIQQRYPYYDRWCDEVAADEYSPLARSLSVAARAIAGTSVTIDGRCLTQSWTGTQLVTLGVVGALHDHANVGVRVLAPDDLGPDAKAFLGARPRVDVITVSEVAAGVGQTDVVHRPYQVSSEADLTMLRALGHRLVLTQLDNIAIRNPGYFPDFNAWRDYRRLNQAALAAADQVVFISRHGADDARTLGLVPEERINVVPPETDEPDEITRVEPRAPEALRRLGSHRFLLCLGTDFVHKNRVFAMRLLGALREQSLFGGTLLFAGPKVAAGSSAGEEAEYLLAHPELSEHVIDIGAVDEAEKRWVIQHAAALLYPTTYEGFGLTAFEAASEGTPSLFAAHTSLEEVLPANTAILVPWDAAASATRAAPVLELGEARDRLVRAIKLAGARFTSRSNARGLERVYIRALRSPSRINSWADPLLLPAEVESLRRLASTILDDPLNRGLVGPNAALPPDLRRPVLAVATRPALRKTATMLYRMGYTLRHGPGKRPVKGAR